jgi:hypothetical protein
MKCIGPRAYCAVVLFRFTLLGEIDSDMLLGTDVLLGTGVRVVDALVVIYLGGWILATPGAYAAGRRWNDRQSPAPHPFWASLFAGAVWPLLLVGLLELSSVIVYTKAIQAWWRRRHLRLAPSVSLKVLPLNTFGG